jgi:hypothetical protein
VVKRGIELDYQKNYNRRLADELYDMGEPEDYSIYLDDDEF